MTADPPDDVETGVTRPPPWTLSVPVVEITRPPAEPAEVRWPPPGAAIDVPWPRTRVTGGELPPPPRVIRLAAPPQGPWRLPLSPALRYMLAHPLPARVVEPDVTR